MIWDPKFAIHGLVVRCPKENIREKSDHWWIGDRFKIRSWSADHFTAIFPIIFFLTSTQRGYYKIHEKLRYFFSTMYLRSLLCEIQNHDLDLISDHKKKWSCSALRKMMTSLGVRCTFLDYEFLKIKFKIFCVCKINYIRLPFLNRNTNLPLLSVRNSVCADNFSNKRTKLFSSTNGEALMFLALTVTLYTVLGVKPVIMCL